MPEGRITVLEKAFVRFAVHLLVDTSSYLTARCRTSARRDLPAPGGVASPTGMNRFFRASSGDRYGRWPRDRESGVALGVPKGFRPRVRAGNRPLDCGSLVSDPVSGISTGLASTPLLHRLPHDATARRRLRGDSLRVPAHLDGLALWRATARTVHTQGSGRTRLRPGGRAPQAGLAARRDGVSAEAESVCHRLQETLATDRHLPSPSLNYQVDMSTAWQRGNARQPVLVVLSRRNSSIS